ncbi:MAG: ParB/RepB/Spo0J family partition protein [Rhodobacteraceae bacterium]|jgi:ParB family chromosome partitioning protein|nr:ParB/RepB/Spo0J family partition protein [Paracoccaceae bacterium]
MTESREPRRGLGRGLSALMADIAPPATPDAIRSPDQSVPVDRLHPNPDQPRRSFPPEALQELAASIRERGIIQPLIVRPLAKKPGHYQIVAGERRWRAAQIAQVHDVPVLVRDYDDPTVLEVAIIENIQRADLNPVDEAAAYRQLMDKFGHTQDRLAEALGKSRSHIANTLRLMSLPEDVLSLVRHGALSAGHARTLIGHPDPAALARRIIVDGLSVRDAERLARAGATAVRRPGSGPKRRGGPPEKDADTRALEADLAATLGLGVSIDHAPEGEGGRLVLTYRSLDQLDDLCRLLSGTG